MKYLFLIICLSNFKAFSQTNCEKLKLALEETRVAYEKAKITVIKNHTAETNATVDFGKAYSTWREALKAWAADEKDLKARAKWNKANKDNDKAIATWKRFQVALLERKKISPLEKPLKEGKKLKAKVIKVCRIDASKTKSFFPSWAVNPK